MQKRTLNERLIYFTSLSVVLVSGLSILPWSNIVTNTLSPFLVYTMVSLFIIGAFAFFSRINELILTCSLGLIAICMHIQTSFNEKLVLPKNDPSAFKIAQLSLTPLDTFGNLLEDITAQLPDFIAINLSDSFQAKEINNTLNRRYSYVIQRNLPQDEQLFFASNNRIQNVQVISSLSHNSLAGDLYIDSLNKSIHFLAFNLPNYLYGSEEGITHFKLLTQHIQNYCPNEPLIVFNTSSINAWSPLIRQFKTATELQETVLNTSSASWSKRIYFSNALQCKSFDSNNKGLPFMSATYHFSDSKKIAPQAISSKDLPAVLSFSIP